MKWFSILALAALLIVTPACEKHPASELEEAAEPHGEAKGEPKHEAEATKPEGAKPESAKPEGEAKPGEAPKFFPETK